jgi:hypothetical protein
MADDPLAKAHQAIGAYFCAFSELERELGQALKVVLRLIGNPAADAIVAAVGDFARKTRIVQEAVQGAKNADGTEPSGEWKAKADKTMADILGCNRPDRVDLAHDYLEPCSDGSVNLQKSGQPARSWSAADLDLKIQKLKDLTTSLRAATDQLFTFKIPIPTHWMSVDVTPWLTPHPFQPAEMNNPSVALLNSEEKKD